MTTQRQLLGYITDYSCRYRHANVIQAVLEKHGLSLASLGVPHARLATASLHKIVHHEIMHGFPTAIVLAEQLFREFGSKQDHAFVHSFIRLLCGLKVKALFYIMEDSPEEALRVFGEYFPRGNGYIDDIVTTPELAQGLRKATTDFRKSIFPIILHPAKREDFMANQYKQRYGRDFTQALKRRVTSFVDSLEKQWPDTFIDMMFKQQKLINTDPTADCLSSSDSLMDILLDFVDGKSSLEPEDLLALVNLLDPHQPLTVHGFTSSFFSSQSASPQEGGGRSSQEIEDQSADGVTAVTERQNFTALASHQETWVQADPMSDVQADYTVTAVIQEQCTAPSHQENCGQLVSDPHTDCVIKAACQEQGTAPSQQENSEQSAFTSDPQADRVIEVAGQEQAGTDLEHTATPSCQEKHSGAEEMEDQLTDGITASQEHTISSSSDSAHTNSGPTDTQPFVVREQTSVHSKGMLNSPVIRQWRVENEAEPDIYGSDGSISDVDNMSRRSCNSCTAEDKSGQMSEAGIQDTEVEAITASFCSPESECEGCTPVRRSPRKKQCIANSSISQQLQLCPHGRQIYCARQCRLLCPNIQRHSKKHDLQPCVVKLMRVPALDNLDGSVNLTSEDTHNITRETLDHVPKHLCQDMC